MLLYDVNIILGIYSRKSESSNTKLYGYSGFLAAGAGPLGQAPLLAGGPGADPVLGGPGQVPLHQRRRAPLRPDYVLGEDINKVFVIAV